jgi:hypothetical protein
MEARMAQKWTDPEPESDDRSWMDACVDRCMTQGPYGGLGPARTRSDAALHEAVSEQLAQDRLLDARGIVVEVEEGVVSLEGQVQTPSDRRLADLLAHQVSGVHQVRNHLAVQPDLFGAAPAFRRRGVVNGDSLGAADRAEAERHPTAPALPPFIT